VRFACCAAFGWHVLREQARGSTHASLAWRALGIPHAHVSLPPAACGDTRQPEYFPQQAAATLSAGPAPAHREGLARALHICAAACATPKEASAIAASVLRSTPHRKQRTQRTVFAKLPTQLYGMRDTPIAAPAPPHVSQVCWVTRGLRTPRRQVGSAIYLQARGRGRVPMADCGMADCGRGAATRLQFQVAAHAILANAKTTFCWAAWALDSPSLRPD